jgi:3-hydroxyacyl-CoA dehydrogenase
MTNALGGGGGKDGFRQLVNRLGPASQGWIEDMNSHAFVFSEENIKKLDDSVQDMLERTEIKGVESQRDEALVDLIKRKKDAPLLK